MMTCSEWCVLMDYTHISFDVADVLQGLRDDE